MSLDYSVDFDTPLPAAELQRCLDIVPVPPTAAVWRSRAVPISARSQAVKHETYGVRPTVGLLYELKTSADDRDQQERDVLANIAALWTLVAGDSYVTYLGGLAVLRRLGQRVTASSEWVDGHPRRRLILDDLLGREYEVAALPGF